jgi:hypothetical protein
MVLATAKSPVLGLLGDRENAEVASQLHLGLNAKYD